MLVCGPPTVPPVIEPFSFGLEDALNTSKAVGGQPARSFSSRSAGSRARLICGLRRGDLPVLFQWLKDGRHLSPQTGQIADLDAFSSLLTISRLADGHTGNYTCLATNPAGKDSYTTSLTVRGTIGS